MPCNSVSLLLKGRNLVLVYSSWDTLGKLLNDQSDILLYLIICSLGNEENVPAQKLQQFLLFLVGNGIMSSRINAVISLIVSVYSFSLPA